MRCLYCQKTIGPVRRFRDAEFCSTEHRRKMSSVSARRAKEEQDEYDPFWPAVSKMDIQPRKQQSSAHSTVIFGLVLATALILGSAGVPFGSGSSGNGASDRTFLSMWKRESTVKFRDEFNAGLTEWKGSSAADGWNRSAGLTHPGKLRLWASSLALTDYEFEFAGQIEKRGMGWAFRAEDIKNYYATKIVISQPGPLPRAELIRYVVTDGTQGPKTRLPLPLLIRTDTLYQVRVNVRNDQFSTLVNGQMVDSWSDNRFKKGGVGLFTDAGEMANIRYTSIANRDSVLGQFLSYFGFWIPPSAVF